MLVVIALLVGCSDKQGQTPGELISATKPLVLLGVGQEGVLIIDADGKLYSYDNQYYFARTIISSGLKSGDILGQTKQPKESK